MMMMIIIIIIIIIIKIPKLRYSVHLTYSFLILRSLRPDSVITNLLIFLSLCYSFMLVAG